MLTLVKVACVAALLIGGCVESSPPAESPPPEDGTRIVHVSWTNSHQPASNATCYAHPSLTVRFRIMPVGGETLSYAPVPCAEGLFTAEVPLRLTMAEVATIESSAGVPIDDSGHAAVDLLDWER